MEDYDRPSLLIDGEDDDDSYLDVVMENLSNMISPKNSGGSMYVDSTMSPPSTSSTSMNAKVSPLVTDIESSQMIQPETSVRGVDENNNPIYATSQTPYGFQAMTKRKTSKKSVFNFEGFEVPEGKSMDASRDDAAAQGVVPMVTDTPTDSPVSVQRRFLRAKPRGSGTEKLLAQAALMVNPDTPVGMENSSIVVKQENQKTLYAFDSMDETAMKSSLEFFNEKEYMDRLKWNALTPNNAAAHELPPLPTPKNPRKKTDTHAEEPVMYNVPYTTEQQVAMYMQQQQLHHQVMMNNGNISLPPYDDGSSPPQQLHHQHHQNTMTTTMYPTQPSSEMYNGYFNNQSAAAAQLHQHQQQMNTSEALRAAWMNPSQSQSSSATQPGNDLTSQLQYYSGDINQLQLPSIRNAPPAVIPDTTSFEFPFAYNGLEGMQQPNIPLDLPPPPNPSNINEIMNYQALFQQKMLELKQQQSLGGGYDPSQQPTGYYPSATSRNNVNITPTNNANSASSSSTLSLSLQRTKQAAHIHNANNDSDTDDVGGGKVSTSGGRASKSLSEISKRFVTIYGKDNTLDYIAGKVHPQDVSDVPISFHRVDAAAEQLGVHVRRIYELIKILEILSLVQFAGDKRGKFSWRGNKDFLRTLGDIQDDGLNAFPLMATQSGLSQLGDLCLPADGLDSAEVRRLAKSMSISPNKDAALSLRGSLFLMDGGSGNSFDLLNLSEEETEKELSTSNPAAKFAATNHSNAINRPTTTNNNSSSHAAGHPQEEQFMVEIICKKFLQLFLVGMNYISMSNAIQKLIPMEENQTLTDYNRVNATKIRRVYDVTNVLCSLNLIRKQTISRKAAFDAEVYNNIDIGSGQTGSNSNSSNGLSVVTITPHPVTAKNATTLAGNTSGATGKKASKNSANSGSNSNNSQGSGGNDRVDAKVLEWTSFNPAVIREQYLFMLRK